MEFLPNNLQYLDFNLSRNKLSTYQENMKNLEENLKQLPSNIEILKLGISGNDIGTNEINAFKEENSKIKDILKNLDKILYF